MVLTKVSLTLSIFEFFLYNCYDSVKFFVDFWYLAIHWVNILSQIHNLRLNLSLIIKWMRIRSRQGLRKHLNLWFGLLLDWLHNEYVRVRRQLCVEELYVFCEYLSALLHGVQFFSRPLLWVRFTNHGHKRIEKYYLREECRQQKVEVDEQLACERVRLHSFIIEHFKLTQHQQVLRKQWINKFVRSLVLCQFAVVFVL